MRNLSMLANMFFKVFAFIACAAYCQAQFFDMECLNDEGSPMTMIEMTKEVRDLIVDLHNEVRTAVSNGSFCNQPKGKNLRKMVYDESLENDAIPVLLTCEFAHVVEDDTVLGQEGQNIFRKNYTSYIEDINWAGAIKAWADECHFFTYPDKSVGVTGHYKQVAWAKTFKVGCGAAISQPNPGQTIYSLIIVCNYLPGGNMKNQLIYTTGEGEDDCKGLCKNDGTPFL